MKGLNLSISLPELAAHKLLPLQKSSPTSSMSWKGLLFDAILIRKSKLIDLFKVYANKTNSILLIDELNRLSLQTGPTSFTRDEKVSTGYLGQLKTKIEPAGKIRVFAMVDV